MSSKKMMSSNEIRQKFFNYFVDKKHALVASSSLIPGNDPTLLFTNAGMVPFKDVFVGTEVRPYTRATSSQRCVRAGGKHNDLENVGYTARHHTFFEMLGNFSFGDYFKYEAIAMCWEFLTVQLGLPKEKLWVSVFEDDKETAKIWINTIGVDKDRVSFCGAEDNFWAMGDTGPCGPCTEIFYDHGKDIPGGPPGSAEQDGDRYIEIWNIVFMQYDRSSDGKLNALPKPSVDTGMGLERLAAVLQGVHNNYDTDIFQGIIKVAAELADISDLENNSLRVIADHIRSTSFLIVDGVVPSNEGRGYVLRRIIRRAIRHGNKLGMGQPFFYKLVAALISVMGEAYPELVKQQTHIEALLKREEELFMQTLAQGLKLLEKAINEMMTDTLAGDIVFKLYDTFGFPADLTADIIREKQLKIDEPAFDACMQQQRDQSRKASGFSVDYNQQVELGEVLKDHSTAFVGYDLLQCQASVLALLQGAQPLEQLQENQQAIVVLDQTPFYGEGGGQVGDKGVLIFEGGEFAVENTTKEGDVHLHHGHLIKGAFKVSQKVTAQVDELARRATQLNHSATHLLHLVLKVVLGDHVQQKGSLVNPQRLRFDFSHFSPITAEQLQTIEKLMNEKIRTNDEVVFSEMTFDQANEAGAMALFGEKYGDTVRTLKMGDSFELCGGTHAKRTGDIGLFKIVSESSVASGVRRIEALTGSPAIDFLYSQTDKVHEQQNKAQQKVRELEKTIDRLKSKLAAQEGGQLQEKAQLVGDVNVLAIEMKGADVKALRETLDQLKNKLGSCAIVLASVENNSVRLISGVSKDVTNRVKAGELVNYVAGQVGGKGGGRPDMAQAGGDQPEHLDKALASVLSWVTEKVS
jgi:alanyl-tRNA synthetase